MIFSFFMTVILIISAVPIFILLTELFAAWNKPKKLIEAKDYAAENCKITVLVPAHNEEATIGLTLESIKPELGPQDRLIVIDDHCRDFTADIAASHGAEVFTRKDDENRGKAHALDFALNQLADAPPDALLIIDADCILKPGSVDKIRAAFLSSGRPIQAINLCHAHRDQSENHAQIAREFSFRIKNLVRARGLYKLAGQVHLSGTGMLLPFEMVRHIGFKSNRLAEDLELGMQLCALGKGAVFLESASVYSPFPQTIEATQIQKTRWIHGHMDLIFSAGPHYLKEAFKRKSWPLFLQTLDMMIPPLGLLGLWLFFLWIVSGGALILSSDVSGTFRNASYLLITYLLTISLFWFRFGRDLISLKALISMAGQTVAQVPIFWRAVFHREKIWQKTERDKGCNKVRDKENNAENGKEKG